MAKKIGIIYFIMAVILISVIFFVDRAFKSDSFSARDDMECVQWDESMFEKTEIIQNNQKYVIYKTQIEEIPYKKQYMIIRSLHQMLEITLNGELILKWNMPEGINPFGKTPGIRWHELLLTEEDAGRYMEIKVTSPYEGNIDIFPEMYFGGRNDIYIRLLADDMLNLIVAALTICIGMIFVIYSMYFIRQLQDRRILYLGIFAVFMGTWSINDMKAVQLFFKNGLTTGYISFSMLMLMPVPFTMFLKEMYGSRKSIVWIVTCCLSLAQSYINIILLLTGVMDFKESVTFTHIVYGIMAVSAVIMTVQEIRHNGFRHRVKINTIFISFCVATLAVDIILYIVSNSIEAALFTSIAFLMYVIVLGCDSVKETYILLQKGKQAKKYEKMAYNDELTGLLNRAALNARISTIKDEAEGFVVIMFDLNNLKLCNDLHGHDAGDLYIRESAEYIRRVFGEGNCYRIGGDEFCVLTDSITKQEIDGYFKKLEALERQFNNSGHKFEMHIAYGYEAYDSEIDVDINATRSRADSRMYHKKFSMKEMTEQV